MDGSCIGDKHDSAVASVRSQVASLIWRLRRQEVTLTADTLDGVAYGSTTGRALMWAASRHPDQELEVVLSGHCVGSVVVGVTLDHDVDFAGSIDGCLFLGTVHGEVTISGSVSMDVVVHGHVTFLRVPGLISGELDLNENCRVRSMTAGGSIGELTIRGEAGLVAVVEDGVVDGGCEIWGTVHTLVIDGAIREGLGISGEVQAVNVNGVLEEDLSVSGSVGEDLQIGGHVDGDLNLSGSIGGTLVVHGSITGDVTIDDSGEVGRNLFVGGRIPTGGYNETARVTGKLRVRGSVGRNLSVNGTVQGPISIDGSVGRDVFVYPSGSVGPLTLWAGASIDHDLQIDGRITGPLDVSGVVEHSLRIGGAVEGFVTVHRSGVIRRRLLLSGTAEALVLQGEVEGRCYLTPSGDRTMPLYSLKGARLGDEVTIGDGVRVDQCDFRQCSDIDKLHLLGADLFPRGIRLSDKPYDETTSIPAEEMAAMYRQFRTNLEQRNNRPSAGAFYTGEMDARHQAARDAGNWVERLLISIYRQVSGYGLIAWKPLVLFFITAAIATLAYELLGGIDGDATLGASANGLDRSDVQQLGRTFWFAALSMVSFFRPPSAELGFWQQAIQFLTRFVGPALIAQFVLAVRERVAR